jgi:hypothetical protein
MQSSRTYQVIDARDLDDVVISCSHRPPLEVLGKCLQGTDFAQALARAARVECYSGPLAAQTKIDIPGFGIDVVDLPIVFRLYLGAAHEFLAYLYITTGTVELHLPERFFVSGDRKVDTERLQFGFEFARDLANALSVKWDHIESEGRERPVCLSLSVWASYGQSLLQRIDIEET